MVVAIAFRIASRLSPVSLKGNDFPPLQAHGITA